MTAPDPAEIARKLTKAQREALKLIAAARRLSIPCSSKSGKALFAKGLIHRAPLGGDRFVVEATYLGLAVVVALRQMEKPDD